MRLIALTRNDVKLAVYQLAIAQIFVTLLLVSLLQQSELEDTRSYKGEI